MCPFDFNSLYKFFLTVGNNALWVFLAFFISFAVKEKTKKLLKNKKYGVYFGLGVLAIFLIFSTDRVQKIEEEQSTDSIKIAIGQSTNEIRKIYEEKTKELKAELDVATRVCYEQGKLKNQENDAMKIEKIDEEQ